MFNSDTDLLFPPRVIANLRTVRGEPWRNLVDRVLQLEPTHPERLGFVLLMVKLVGCTSCHADSFRALKGCTQCSHQGVRRFRGSDSDLLILFDEACKEIHRYVDS